MDTQKEYATLMEAYNAVYENQEQLDGNILEGSYEDRIAANNKKYDANRKRAAQRAQARNEARARGENVGSSRPERTTYRDSAGVERHHSGARMPKKEEQKESFDLFDYLLEYLVAEGYADTNKAALAIMANMSEEWKQSIMEGHGSRTSFKKQSEDERGRISMFKGSKIEYTPHKNFDPKANRGQGQILRPNQAEKQRRKKLAQSAMDDNR